MVPPAQEFYISGIFPGVDLQQTKFNKNSIERPLRASSKGRTPLASLARTSKKTSVAPPKKQSEIGKYYLFEYNMSKQR